MRYKQTNMLMLKSILTILGFTFLLGSAAAQLTIKGGVYTTQITSDSIGINIPPTLSNYYLAVQKSRIGFVIGANYKILMNSFFIQPEILINSSSTQYMITEPNLPSKAIEESYQFLDIPLMFGFNIGVLNLFGGPVGHVFLGSSSELDNIAGFDEKQNDLLWGWQAGLGFDIWRLNLDIRYEGNFYNYGNHINFFGTQYDFDSRPTRIITTLGLRLGS